jgi:hypothetical protein
MAMMAITTSNSMRVKAVRINFPAGGRNGGVAFIKGLCIL